MAPESDAMYGELRLSQTHDTWHVITGFDTSVNGEIGLQAFQLTQIPYPLASVLTAHALLSTTILEADQLQSRPRFVQRWEEGWEKSLTPWRQELNLLPFHELDGVSMHGRAEIGQP
jgi:ubiquinone biosynthesis protein Coq4